MISSAVICFFTTCILKISFARHVTRPIKRHVWAGSSNHSENCISLWKKRLQPYKVNYKVMTFSILTTGKQSQCLWKVTDCLICLCIKSLAILIHLYAAKHWYPSFGKVKWYSCAFLLIEDTYMNSWMAIFPFFYFFKWFLQMKHLVRWDSFAIDEMPFELCIIKKLS